MIKIGDLVYIPSDVAIFTKQSVKKLKTPSHLLVTGETDEYYEVLFNNSRWYVWSKDVYPME